MSKTQLYQDLYKRMKEAINSGYYLEACWIQYSIVEDRLNSVIRHAYPKKGIKFLEGFRGLERKIKHVKDKIHDRDEDCRKTVHKRLLGNISTWKSKRDNLMHEIINEGSYPKLQTETRKLALRGSELIDDLSIRVRKYKTKVKKRK